MKREEIVDLMAFVVVVEERSFIRVVVRLSMAQLVLSQIVRRIEERLGLRFLTRITRSVVLIEAGEYFLFVFGFMLYDIDLVMVFLSDLQNRLFGIIRIIIVEYVVKTILLLVMRIFLKSYFEIDIQFIIDYGLIDVVFERFDVGVRLGGEMDKDMIVIRIGLDILMVIVGLSDYFFRRSVLTLVL